MSFLNDALCEINKLKDKPFSVKKEEKVIEPKEKESFLINDWSDEQLSILKSNHLKTSVVALAGTGKTKTALQYMSDSPLQKWLYVTFNRSMKKEVEAKVSSNVRASTLHGWVFAKFGAPLQHKLIKEPDVFEILKASQANPPNSIQKIYAQLLWKTVEIFSQSNDDFLKLNHIPSDLWWAVLKHPSNLSTPEEIIKESYHLWQSCIDPKTSTPSSHDHYLKLAQLSNMQFHRSVLLDEAQDASECMLSLISNQKNNIMLMGDPYQTLYAFRGAFGDFASDSNHILPLTGSYRFGKNIASIANIALKNLKSDWLLTGKSQINGEIIFEDLPVLSDTILTHTNEKALEWGFELMAKNHSVQWIGSVEKTWLRIIKLSDWKNENLKTDESWKSFKNFKQYEDWVLEMPEHPDFLAIKWLKKGMKNNESWMTTFKRLKNDNFLKNTNENSFKIGTIHQSKGLAFENVFLDEEIMNGFENSKENKEIWQRVYVALTRSQKTIRMSKNLFEKINKTTSNSHFLQKISSLDSF